MTLARSKRQSAACQLTFRLAAHDNDTIGYVLNSQNGGYFPGDEDFGVRGTAVFTPLAEARLTLSYQTPTTTSSGTAFSASIPTTSYRRPSARGLLNGVAEPSAPVTPIDPKQRVVRAKSARPSCQQKTLAGETAPPRWGAVMG